MGLFNDLMKALASDDFEPGYGRNRLQRNWWKLEGFVALKSTTDHGPFLDVVGESHYQAVFADHIGRRFEKGVYWDVVVRIGIVNLPEDPMALGVVIDDQGCGFVSRSEKDALLAELEAIIPETGCRGAICKGQIVGGYRKGNGQASYGLKLMLERPLAIKTR